MKRLVPASGLALAALGCFTACNFGADDFEIVPAQDGSAESLGGNGPGGAVSGGGGNVGQTGGQPGTGGNTAACEDKVILADDFDDPVVADVGIRANRWSNYFGADEACTWSQGTVVTAPPLDVICAPQNALIEPLQLNSFHIRIATDVDAPDEVQLQFITADTSIAGGIGITASGVRVFRDDGQDLLVASGTLGDQQYVELNVVNGVAKVEVASATYASDGGTPMTAAEGALPAEAWSLGTRKVNAIVVVLSPSEGGSAKLLDLRLTNGCP